jgi:hypothetical protein
MLLGVLDIDDFVDGTSFRSVILALSVMVVIAYNGRFEYTSNYPMRYRISVCLCFEQKAFLLRNELITISFDEWVSCDNIFEYLKNKL